MAAPACEQYEATTPYFAFRRLLGSLLAVELERRRSGATHASSVSGRTTSRRTSCHGTCSLGDVLDAAVLSTPEVDELEPSFRRARLNGVVEDLLTRLLDPPTLVLFEDAHWMDEASSDLLRHLGSRCRRSRGSSA